jgi:two-component system, NtrC family, sensor histidine kinase KinB
VKLSIKTRFTSGMIFLFLIILVLSFFSGYYLNKMSKKTSAILKENYLSMVYARDMSEGITEINREITTAYLSGTLIDSLKIKDEFNLINKSLQLEKNNITEAGEDKLVSNIETQYNIYKKSVLQFIGSSMKPASMASLENDSRDLDHSFILLSRMNGKAQELKTDEAKAYSRRALTRMTILGTYCLLIGIGFTYGFASYFNQRFFQLYNGIKEIVSSNYDQHLFFDGKDEFYEISLLLNEMAAKLKENKQKMSVTLPDAHLKESMSGDIEAMKKLLLKMRSLEEEASALISKVEAKQ